MNSDEFLQDHAKWKYGQGKEIKQEQPCTWLMVIKSGHYFRLEGNLDAELGRLREIGMPCVAHHDQTSVSMSLVQSKYERPSNDPI